MALSDGLVQSMGMGRVFKVCSCWLSSHTAMALPPAAGSSALPCLSSRQVILRDTVDMIGNMRPVWAHSLRWCSVLPSMQHRLFDTMHLANDRTRRRPSTPWISTARKTCW